MGDWKNNRAKTTTEIRISIVDLINALDKVSGIDIEDLDGTEIELDDEDVVITMPITLDVSTYYDPGCMYRANGDPGDPPDWDMREQYSEKDISNAIETVKLPISFEINDDISEWEFEE